MFSYLKRAASAFLAAAMVLTFSPAYALAAETTENGIPSEIAEELPTGPPAEEPEITLEASLETSGDDAPEEREPDAVLYEAASGTCGDNLTWVLDEAGTLTISGTGKMSSSIPWDWMDDSIKKVVIEEGVTSIGSDAFAGCIGLTNVAIPESVTSIENGAFYNCNGLTSVTIPGSVTFIGIYAFHGCSGLTSVTIPESVTSIGKGAFYDCSKLTSVTIPGNITFIVSCAFHGCSGLTSVTIPEGVTSIESSAFSDCSGLTSVTIPEGVISIEDSAFYGCSGLTDVTIPESVISIGDSAFYGCSGLTGVTIPESVISIGDSAFYGCSGLTSVIIPESVTSIGSSVFYDEQSKLTSAGPIGGDYCYQFGWKTEIPSNAFSGCRSLTSVTIPESVTSIGSSAFSGCSSLISLAIPEGVSSIGSAAFSECGLTGMTIPESVTSISDSLFARCSSLTSITIPESVTTIGDSAFTDCKSLTSMTIPGRVTSIGNSAFDFCSSLNRIAVSSGNSNYADEDGVLLNRQKSILICYPAGKSSPSYVIPDSITSIGASAFHCCKLANVIIPESVTSIGHDAFADCNGLTRITIPESVTFIGSSSFARCSKLTNVTIPKGVTSIANSMFVGCRSLTSVTIPDGVTSIGRRAFSNCSDLTSVIIPDSVTSIGADAFSLCKGLISVTIPEGVTSIGDYAFSYCSGLTSVIIQEGVSSIGDYAFSYCSELTSVIIPESVTSIGDHAFNDHNPDLYIYCLPGSYAEAYAIENGIFYAYSNMGDEDVLSWLTSNATGGVVAGTEFLIRAGYQAQNSASTLQIELPEGITLSNGGIWLDGKELAADSCTLTNRSLTVPLAGLSVTRAHTLHLYCTATAAGSYSISGTLTLQNGESHSLGTAVIQVEQARLNVPEKVGYTSGIIATGKANPGCAVTLFVDSSKAGQATTNNAGSWQISFDLGSGTESGSTHTVYAEIQLESGQKVQTETAAVIYQACAVKPVKLTMYNTDDHGARETVFDFTKTEEANLVRYYRIWPSRYPSFTFKAEFSGDPSTLGSVFILTTDSTGKETKIPAVYDPLSHSWAGTHDYTNFQDAPVWVRVVYSAEEISSNKLSAVPIMDPSGYVYEAVPSNRLAGITATISCDQDGNTPWNANAFDQVNPQITGADGSYYWDVPAGLWKVTFTKEGYTDTSTSWLTVPPPQVDINVPMVSTAAPKVKCAAVYEDYAEITFSQYMDINSVKSAITLNGTAATVEALDAADNAEKATQYATRFKATAAGLSGQAELTVGAALNYAGTAMQESYTRSFPVETRPTGITAPETVSMKMSDGQGIHAALVPKLSGQTLAIENLTPAIISVSKTSATTDSNGDVEIPIKALLPGTGILRIAEPISGLETTVSIQVKADVEPKISIDASIEGRILNYRTSNVPENLGAKLIIASYNNQRMSTAVITEELSGTLELNNLSASAYVLFLVESDTMKPLCSNFTVFVKTGSVS